MFSILNKYFHYVSRKQKLVKCKSLETKLDRCLSVYQLIFYGLSHMIGAGIYVLTGHIIKERTGSATNLSFLLSGVISIFTGLCYCEFSTLIPKAGSCYTYTYLLMGELAAFIIGWTMIMDLIIGLASISKGFSGALNLLCNNAIRNFTEVHVPLSKDSEIFDSSVDLVAFALLLILFLITLTGANTSMNINSILALLQLGFLTTIITACFIYGSHENYLADGGYLPFGLASIFQGAGIAIFAYSGFECLANSAEETKEPKKSIPIALFISLGIVILLYIFASTSLSFMVPRLQIDEKAPFIAAFARKNLMSLKWIAGFATLLATGANKLTVVYVVPRILYAMANDGLLFRFLGKIEKTSKTPVSALIVGVLFSSVLALFVKLEILADITSMGIIISFISIGVNLIILRYIHAEEPNMSDSNGPKEMRMRVSISPIFSNQKIFITFFLNLILWIFLLGVSLNYAFLISNIVGKISVIVSLIFVIAFTIFLSFYEPNSSNDAFETPLMPLTPIITISLNTCLLLTLSGGTWIRFFVWTLIGLLIYFFYGIRNSNLTEKEEEKVELIESDSKGENVSVKE